ncbi:hypothetical protein [Pollutimonas bauzanensis]|uniref:Uncharacterized protein n=1 Tax=Pollutimonas bauzanensis TaxID=658167 RepID=A0A1M6BTT9_9BURK|nr:hypothetical protein [Pollutimonas bauzanensis]SHI52140.1 hypothetical protein SAMN04488135_12917 [Pollutimonas bauzanensis]
MAEDLARLDELFVKHLRLFSKRPLPFGLEVHAGWTDLLDTLLSRIETILDDIPDASFEILQVKEKFGTLRFYYQIDNASDTATAAIRQAVEATAAASSFCCERCGASGQLDSKNGWMRVRCRTCDDD